MLPKLKVSMALSCLIVCMVIAQPSHALLTQVNHVDLPQCDPLSIPNTVHEIGDPVGGFPADQSLLPGTFGSANPSCLATDSTALPDFLVSITNTSGKDFQSVWYIADEETRISNLDGFANDFAFSVAAGQEAFRIDNDITDPAGINHPLRFESILPDGIWQSGEEWRFVLQDYGNLLGLAPNAIASMGVGNASIDLPPFQPISSGSIIARVPEPATIALLFVSLARIGLQRNAIHQPKRSMP